MSIVLLDMALSLDGYVAGLNDEDGGLNNWFFTPSGTEPDINQQVVAESVNSLGAIIMGRRTYEMGAQANGFADTPYSADHFVLTHTPPTTRVAGAEAFTFVTDGIESALKQAQAAANGKTIAIGGGADVAQQFLAAGLVDEIYIHLVPVLFGAGKRLFTLDTLLTLEPIVTLPTNTVTHLRYRVIR